MLAVLAAVTVLPLVAPGAASAAPGDPRPIPPAFEVELTDAGFEPATASLTVGQTLIVHNATAAARGLATEDGTIDAGSVGPGDRMVTAFPQEAAGVLDLTDGITPDPHHLEIVVGQLELVGDPTSPVGVAIPDLVPAAVPSLVHPDLGVLVARNRVVLSFLPGATIAMANDALAAGGLTVVGGFTRFELLMAEVAGNPDPDDARTIQTSIDAIRGMPGIASVSYDIGLAGQESLPRPPIPDPGTSLGQPYQWDGSVDDTGAATGVGGNWGLEASRFPQAWNAADVARDRPEWERPDTVIFDAGFHPDHPDLTGATLHRLCTTTASGPSCTENDPGFAAGFSSHHGTGTGGVVGAAFDRNPAGAPTSQGTVGADPVADLHLVPFHDFAELSATPILELYEFASGIDLILDNRPTSFPRLRTINFSGGPVFLVDNGAGWNNRWNAETCGPAAGDDATAAERVRCTPSTEDGFLREFEAYTRGYTDLVSELALANVLFVSAAGNEGWDVCATSPIPASGCTDFAPMPSWALNPFALIAEREAQPTPLIDVAAYEQDLDRPVFSNGGMVSAPGVQIVIPRKKGDGTFGWALDSGTSYAAPYVSGLASYLAAIDPALGWADIKQAIVDGAAHDVDDGAPRIDAYASVLLTPNGLDAVLDANDTSPDGNRRVIYDDEGNPLGSDPLLGTGTSPYSAPDGRIDIRDLRRFRDLYLDQCIVGDDAGCPVEAQIDLDGPENHPKKDGNLDRCFGTPGSPCDYDESHYSRVDFNGDGTLDDRAIPVPVGPDGGPATTPDDLTLSDLDLLRLLWPADAAADPDATGGWGRDDLDRLLSSADVEVRLDHLWEQGVTEAKVTAFTTDGEAPSRTFVPGPPGDIRTFSVPLTLAPDGTEAAVQVRVETTVPGQADPEIYLSDILPAKAGSDLVVMPCTGRLHLAADATNLPLGGSTTVRAMLLDCFGNKLEGEEVGFIAVGGPAGATITDVTPTDANGVATAIYRNPPGVNGPVRIGAVLDDALTGNPTSAIVDLDTLPELTVHYHVRQSVLEYERHSTNDWPDGGDDCDSPIETAAPRVEFNCFESTQIAGEVRFNPLGDIDSGLPVMERRGTITPNATGGATVVEEARIVAMRGNEYVPLQQGAALRTTVREWKPGEPATARTRVYDSWSYLTGQVLPTLAVSTEYVDPVTVEMPDVHFVQSPDGVQVTGMDELSRMALHEHTIGSLRRGVLQDPFELHPDVPIRRFTPLSNQSPDFTLGPRLDGTAFKYAADEGGPMVFTAVDGPSYCVVVDRSLDGATGYWNDTDPQVSATIRDTDDRRPVREPGDRAAPVHSGHLRSRFEFSAILSPLDGEADPPPFPTDCPDETQPVTFSTSPTPVVEGTEVRFSDTSVHTAGATGHSWDFGDGSPPSTEAAPTHVYADDLTFPVTMSVTDDLGITHTSPATNVDVVNATPELEVLGIVGDADQPQLQVQVDDPSPIDRTMLEVRLTSPTPGFGTPAPQFLQPPRDPSDPEAFLPGPFTGNLNLPVGLAPRVYFVTVTLADKDGATATTSLSVAVTASDGVPGADVADGPTASGVAAPRTTVGGGVGPGPSMPVTAAAPDVAVPAFVIEGVDVATGETVSIRNATRQGDEPIGATLDPGDGRALVSLPAGGATALSWLGAGTFAVSMSAPGATASADVTVTGPAVPPTITSESPVSGAQGAAAPVGARITDGDGDPVAGTIVRFALASAPDVDVEAVTAADGRAGAELPITGVAGATTLVITVLPDVTASFPFTVTANQAPVADAGGPYTVSPDNALELHASATDVDPADTALLTFAWDLDDDGSFDDAVGPDPTLSAVEITAVLCGGTPCEPGLVRDVRVRARDPKGGTGVDDATVSFVRDFALAVTPASATLVSEAWTSFTVTVSSENGYDQPVTLSTVGLPAGVTSIFSSSTVTPNGTAVLSVRADASVADQTFPLVVRGVGADGTARESSTEIDLEFGLIPVCTGTVQGRVFDRETGQGIAEVALFGAITAADGTYVSTTVPLGSGNAPQLVGRQLQVPGYHPLQVTGTVGCGVVTTIDAALLRRAYATVEGTVTGYSADGLTPIGPVAGARVGTQTTDANGRYRFAQLPVGSQNEPVDVNMTATAPPGSNYHASPTRTGRIEAGQTTVIDLSMRTICRASVRAQVVDERTGQPFPGARVNGMDADANGVVVLTDLALGSPDNRPRNVQVTASTPVDVFPVVTQSKSVTLPFCGGVTPVTLVISRPHTVVTTLDVTVVDDETGEPVPAANVAVNNQYFGTVDGLGHLRADYRIGVDVPSEAVVGISAGREGYWPLPTLTYTVREGQVTTITVRLLKKRTGIVEGTVRDKETGAPVAGIQVNAIGGGGTSGPDGRYRFEVALGSGNTPIDRTVRATDLGSPRRFWSSDPVPVTVTATEPATADLTVLRVCRGATIRGRVINAATGEPLEEAYVVITSTLSNSSFTDADGRFVLQDVPVGDQNRPLAQTVQASKPGFLTATKVVTVFCGADIVVDFGRPEPADATITGHVTDGDGDPVVGAFVGTGFGGTDTTGTDGGYTITQVPVGEAGVPRDWAVTVQPPAGSGLAPATKTATVLPATSTTLDFQLGEAANEPPTALDLDYESEGEPVDVLLAGADPNGDPLTFTVVGQPTNGSLSGTAPALTYTPAAGFVGDDSFTYTASDGVLTSAPATVTISVAVPNQVPVAVIATDPSGSPTTVDEGTAIGLTGAGSTDPDGTIETYEWDLDGNGTYESDGVDASVFEGDDAVTAVALRVTDDDGDVATDQLVLTWVNGLPEVDAGEDDEVVVGAELVHEWDVVDPGDDDLTATADWGDGTEPEDLDVDEHELVHTFAVAGTFTVTVEVCDDDGGCATDTFDVLVVPVVATTTTTTTTAPTTTTTTAPTTTTTTTAPTTTTTTAPTTTTTTTAPTTTTTTTAPTTSTSSTSTTSTTVVGETTTTTGALSSTTTVAGDPGPASTSTTAAVAPAATDRAAADPSAVAATGATRASTGSLPITGTGLALVAVGLALVTAGATLIAIRRRSR